MRAMARCAKLPSTGKSSPPVPWDAKYSTSPTPTKLYMAEVLRFIENQRPDQSTVGRDRCPYDRAGGAHMRGHHRCRHDHRGATFEQAATSLTLPIWILRRRVRRYLADPCMLPCRVAKWNDEGGLPTRLGDRYRGSLNLPSHCSVAECTKTLC